MSASDFKFMPDIVVLVAMDGNSELLTVAASIRRAGLSCVCFSNFHTMMEHWRHLNPAIILVDAAVADEFFRCRSQSDVFQDPPVIEIVPPEIDSRVKAFAAGAVDCIIKPVIDEDLFAHLRTQLELQAEQKQLKPANV